MPLATKVGDKSHPNKAASWHLRNKITPLRVSCTSAWTPSRSAVATGENVMRTKVAIAVVALLGGALMLPNHEALARGGGFGGGGFHGGGFGGGGFHGGGFGGGGFRSVGGGSFRFPAFGGGGFRLAPS